MLHNLRKRIEAGETLIGTWLYLDDVGVAELVAQAGFDFVMIDMEHSPTGFGDLRCLIMAVERHAVPLVRVKANSPEFISAILDLGPGGIMVPRVNSREQAAAAVQYAKYHPLGQRGFGPYRASEYARNMRDYLERANQEQLLWLQIEHADAIAAIDGIAAVPGVDGLFFGRGDLSQSLGHLGDPNNQQVTDTVCTAMRHGAVARLPLGSAFGSGDDLGFWAAAGIRIFTVDADFRFVLNGAAASLTATRKKLSGAVCAEARHG